MNEYQSVLTDAGVGGAIGGLLSAMLIAYDSLKKIPNRNNEEETTPTQRVYFIIIRTLFGSLTAMLFANWLMDNVIAGGLSKSKFIFVSGMIGFNIGFLTSVSKILERTVTKMFSNKDKEQDEINNAQSGPRN